MQQRVLVPLAGSFGFHFAGNALSRIAEPLRRGDFSIMQEMHAASSALKAAGAFYVTGALEELRRAQGGLGFSLLSGMPTFVGQIARLNTVEGDNYILSRFVSLRNENKARKSPANLLFQSHHLPLTEQTARWLLKQVAPLLKPKAGAKPIKLPTTIKHLERIGQIDTEKCPAKKREDFRDPAVQVHAVSHWAMRSLKDLYTEVEVNGKSVIGWLMTRSRRRLSSCLVVSLTRSHF